MSEYKPKHGTLTAVKRPDGWWIDDRYGPFDGPYATRLDAMSVIQGIEEGDDLAMAQG